MHRRHLLRGAARLIEASLAKQMLLLLPLYRLDKLKGQKFFSTSPQHTHEHYMQVRYTA
jgi:hypothetical protein